MIELQFFRGAKWPSQQGRGRHRSTDNGFGLLKLGERYARSAIYPSEPSSGRADHATLHRLFVATNEFRFAVEHSNGQIDELRARLGK